MFNEKGRAIIFNQLTNVKIPVTIIYILLSEWIYLSHCIFYVLFLNKRVFSK